ncbi:hypothetical protein SERLA73DRAFT_180111 [Serpula lacrymans var. lacrymans S7.3]|uniref:RING-type domain-containing protein n=2 Tax=Serpula lacrymans var. lacrymans TaxID=341189 RepID=F8PW03_SERL3|nr:uncharacterized protein SERLADRAFT_465571 [Serpula lacrymans var. lacrymans S7.9]EGN99862.1 hypothetical protein SERLA73DRAFT_180111 [Serpula lacrymans var. lacrymans S7.3]EGO25431.1 hypothetical protein SERLADRAFT_465571 [Serpula lacrymans var. lacrymans S7.9]
MPLPPPAPPAYSPENCAICLESLHIPSNDDEGPSQIIDDVELHCGPPGSGASGHHFHWSCIMEWAKTGGDKSRCPLCRQNTLDRNGRFIVDVRNEGGFTGGMDLGEEIDEELYLDAHPEERYKIAFLGFMAQSDFDEAGLVLREHGVDVNSAYVPGGQTAMHMAALNDDVEGIQFLLQNGANPHTKDDTGMIPLDLARDVDAGRAVSMLQNL